MDAELWIDPDRRALVLRLVGVASFPELLQAQQALRSVMRDMGVRPGIPRLLDMSRGSLHFLSHDDLALAARALSERGAEPCVPRAFVAPQAVTYGECRVLQAYADSYWRNTAIFHDAGSACEWLGLRPDYIDRLYTSDAEEFISLLGEPAPVQIA